MNAPRRRFLSAQRSSKNTAAATAPARIAKNPWTYHTLLANSPANVARNAARRMRNAATRTRPSRKNTSSKRRPPSTRCIRLPPRDRTRVSVNGSYDATGPWLCAIARQSGGLRRSASSSTATGVDPRPVDSVPERGLRRPGPRATRAADWPLIRINCTGSAFCLPVHSRRFALVTATAYSSPPANIASACALFRNTRRW